MKKKNLNAPISNKKKSYFGNWVSRCLEMPFHSLLDIPRIEITDQNEALIFGCESISAYTSSEIKLDMKRYMLYVYGADLNLMTYSKGVIAVMGHLKTIQMAENSFEKIEGCDT